MSRPYCGIDFGTSNSAVCAGLGDHVRLVPVEGDAVTLPSAIFFNFETEEVSHGRKAIAEYLDHYDGRLMRALKSILGSSLIGETTQVGNRRKDFRAIIGIYIGELKARAERFAGHAIDQVVLGRPVRFVDHDDVADARAEAELRGIAQAQGFREIAFEYEPLAAARDYQSGLQQAETVLVVDIGGGTSDFSVVELGPMGGDSRILANGGVHIGGTDFDTRLSLATVMRDMGYRTPLKSGLEMPGLYYHQLSTWHLINFLYTQKTMTGVRQLHHQAADRSLTQRLISTIEHRAGHEIASKVEQAKIAVSDGELARMDLTGIDDGWTHDVTRDALIGAIAADVQKVVDAATDTVVTRAGLPPSRIETLFMTGGSTGLPGFEAAMRAAFPQARVHYGDRFASVASGLGLAAKERYGT
ncbi:dnaK-type molecular chaperone dnaK [Asticcacaulis biprosthecium C19]|uniref:DnaK-type molecular chaperone dnaK n=1 Tax=Asticcacaulis biprosthecium C19 TaxID=715226 RepID=F4QJG5_9CAUL|nr:Hsp70 family protein [Asticcacaulis biprosthecium]EGF93148.1 dnaK-type molecular chaperone dnaK [Asticcacaulis biprosthecium C19]